ncbi:unnamed protein product [Calypogeia fissa]
MGRKRCGLAQRHITGELIPGIKDDITLAHITTKLLWRDNYVLSSDVSSKQLHWRTKKISGFFELLPSREGRVENGGKR